MEIKHLQIKKIDIELNAIENIDPSQYGEDLDNYLESLFTLVTDPLKGRKYNFRGETTEVRNQIGQIIPDRERIDADVFAEITGVISRRLLRFETDAQIRVQQLGVEVQRGLIVTSLVIEDNLLKLVICKAEHNDFLSETNFRRQRGLPYKKKVFKSFVCTFDEGGIITNPTVYDSNTEQTKYWWSDFLELEKIYTDEDNTRNAMESFDKMVFNKIKAKHPQDYVHLRNNTVYYLRSNNTFDMEDFLNRGIGDYLPFDSSLDINKLKRTISELPEKSRKPFDANFTIIKKEIKARALSTIQLTDEIDLRIKEGVEDLDNVITAYQDEAGVKYVKIKSDKGYKHFKKESTQ